MSNQCIQSDAKSPDINFFSVTSPVDDLGSPIAWGPSDGQHFSCHSLFPKFLEKLVVDDFETLRVGIIEDVIQFDIPMGQSLSVQVFEAITYLACH